ncbi:L-seryl-tRNA(Sec) kinase [Episyrphus balteatus]|uniref:L-seryl-tRNA(Sec) kinase n=1 Tax=Episyrphus balteatus TaxID=286459 RepID=UPI0024864E7F|nr:L-seryl-tRNA(Sec) kinase [Episyrphus balteatus]
MVNICLLALIGLPGAGKTTFCKNILKSSLEYNFIHICYDELFKYHPESSEASFKDERTKVIKKIEQIIDELKMKNQEEKDDSNMNCPKLSVILVDDNNYYAGMRYEFYKVCKSSNLSFGQVYFPVDLDCALARNASRGKNALPSFLIERMNERLESPSEKNQWERYTLIVNYNSEDFAQFSSFLKTCFLNPLKSIPKPNNNPTMEAYLIHEVDIGLRKRIKEILQNSKGNISENAAILNKKRKHILLEMQKRNEFDPSLNVQSICESFNL